MNNKNYSRLARVQESQNQRSTVIFIALTILLFIFLVLFGIPIAAKLTSIFGNLRGNKQVSLIKDTTPPAPPYINQIAEFTNQIKLKINGTAESASIIKLTVNEEEITLATNEDGEFNTETTLKKGANKISAKAVDKAGNESNDTRKFSVTYDKDAPTIEISQPQDNSNFFGDKQKQVTIIGKTSEETTVTINDNIAIIESDGRFRSSTTLSPGANTFKIVATDKAGNKTDTALTLNFTP